jgi:acetate kinase
MVAVFDTGFHETMPEHAARYAIPHELTSTHSIYRYGFHGLAHRYMAEALASVHGVNEGRLVTLQLGSGSSAAAIKDGRSLDTSMGFTPLEGLVMGTRSGDLDPAVVSFLVQREGASAAEVEQWLNQRSGLLGVSGLSADVRDLLGAERRGDARAALAIEMFCYRIRKQIGAYMSVLEGLDALVFGGGIGENSPEIRARVCDGMTWAGIELDPKRNAAPYAAPGRISADGSAVEVLVVKVDEELLIARDTCALIRASSPSP